ncbi:hypothetical protein JOM56_001958 [Amanita muscaria]
MPEAIALQQRIVPGAPPPAPLSKTQKKKRKAKAKTGGENSTDGNIDNIDRADSPAASVPDASAGALIDKAHDGADVQKSLLAPDLAAQPEPQTPTIPEELKPNTVAGLVNKRLKATTKKIARITAYAATDPEKLDDDQKRILKTLPTLEAIQKELVEVKKAVEVYEADFAQEFVAKKLEAERAERAKIAETVAASQNESIQKVADILDLLRLRSLLDAGEVDTPTVDEHESSALLTITETLLSNDQEKRMPVIRGLLLGAEESNGISCARLTEITQLGLALPRAPTPIAEPTVEQPEPETELELETAPAVAPVGVPEVAPASKGFSFVQESEIDEARPADDDEWIDAGVVPEAQAPEGELANGHVQQEEVQALETAPPVFPEPATSAPLDWATDDGDLPPIADVQESIGASVSATAGDVQPKATGEENTGENSPLSNRRPEEEGFTHFGGGRGRGRGPRGERGERGGYRNRGERGGFRGERGSFRGGERGGFRGERGGPHGGERSGFHGGERGGFHGGERGEFHGGERGGFRGGERGEYGGQRGGERGEPQGNDRGEFRGGYRGRGEGREGGRGGMLMFPSPYKLAS